MIKYRKEGQKTQGAEIFLKSVEGQNMHDHTFNGKGVYIS